MTENSFEIENIKTKFVNTEDIPFTFLPPGSEVLDLPIAGLLQLQIGNLTELKTTANFENIKIKPSFWGENESKFLLRAENTSLSEENACFCCANYLIKCSPIQFQRYLKDMKILKLYLVDKRNLKCLGIVQIDILPFLKKSATQFDLKPIEDIQGVFCVKKPPTAIENKSHPTEIGNIEIILNCEFGGNYESKLETETNYLPIPKQKESDEQGRIQTLSKFGAEKPKITPKDQHHSELSQLIEKTEKLIDDMNLEEIRNDKNLKQELRVKELQQELQKNEEIVKKKKHLPIEIELELLKMQKNRLKVEKQTVFADENKVIHNFSNSKNQMKNLKISLHTFDTEVDSYQKSITENITFVRLDLANNNNVTLETYKLTN